VSWNRSAREGGAGASPAALGGAFTAVATAEA